MTTEVLQVKCKHLCFVCDSCLLCLCKKVLLILVCSSTDHCVGVLVAVALLTAHLTASQSFSKYSQSMARYICSHHSPCCHQQQELHLVLAASTPSQNCPSGLACPINLLDKLDSVLQMQAVNTVLRP